MTKDEKEKFELLMKSLQEKKESVATELARLTELHNNASREVLSARKLYNEARSAEDNLCIALRKTENDLLLTLKRSVSKPKTLVKYKFKNTSSGLILKEFNLQVLSSKQMIEYLTIAEGRLFLIEKEAIDSINLLVHKLENERRLYNSAARDLSATEAGLEKAKISRKHLRSELQVQESVLSAIEDQKTQEASKLIAEFFPEHKSSLQEEEDLVAAELAKLKESYNNFSQHILSINESRSKALGARGESFIELETKEGELLSIIKDVILSQTVPDDDVLKKTILLDAYQALVKKAEEIRIMRSDTPPVLEQELGDDYLDDRADEEEEMRLKGFIDGTLIPVERMKIGTMFGVVEQLEHKMAHYDYVVQGINDKDNELKKYKILREPAHSELQVKESELYNIKAKKIQEALELIAEAFPEHESSLGTSGSALPKEQLKSEHDKDKSKDSDVAVSSEVPARLSFTSAFSIMSKVKGLISKL